MHRGGVRGSSSGTGPSLPRRVDLGRPRRGGGRDVASPVPRCLYRCAPAVELGARRAEGERQMEPVLCAVVPAWLFGVGWRGGSWPGSTRERRGRRKDSPHAGTQPGPGLPAHASSSEPRRPEVLLGFYQGFYPRSRRERVLPRGLQGDPCSLSRFVASGK